MLSIQTNVNSLIAQQNLSVNNVFQSKTIEQLTSGYRINQSGDDAAGLAVANGYRNSIAELTQGVSNGNDAAAQLQIMDGGMSNISQILDRLKTLAVQSASGSFTGTRSTLNTEFQTDLNEINRQAQSIGLNTGGLFTTNMSVYLGQGSGSMSQANSLVNVNLAQSAVDAQALGLSGMQVVNADVNTGLVSNSIGNGATSVQNIVSNTSGGNANQEAVAGYANFQFSGPGFADGGKISVSVNLAGVSDVPTLAAAVNQAIGAAGTGSAAAEAFKAANIVASVYTDSAGNQALAFSSSTSAFQVQAGDQMANALMGNVSVVGGVAQGAAVNTPTVTGSTTSSGTFAQPQNVHLTITGGGLATAQTLTLNSSDSSTSSAIADLMNQFASSTTLAAAGLTMSNSAGGSTVGGQLSFNSANGQSFNVQMTGDTQNLLGLGSFLSNTQTGSAVYSSITAGAAYDPTAVTGVLGTTQGKAAGLEISINGAAATALTAVDLTAGAHAAAASVTSGGLALGGVDITNANKALDITVVNNGVATEWAGNLTTNQAATSGSVSSASIDSASSVVVDATHNTFNISVDGGQSVAITLDNGTYTGTDASSLAAEINTKIGLSDLNGLVSAGFDPTSGFLTFTSASTGANSSVSVGNGATNDLLSTTAGKELDFTNGQIGFGQADQPSTLASIAAQIQTGLGAAAVVTVGNNGKLNIASATNGANSEVIINTPASNSANTVLKLTAANGAQTTHGTNSTIADIVSNLNAQFAASQQFQQAGLQASATGSNGSGNGNYITISSTNGTQFRLNALGGGSAAAEDVGFGTAGSSFTSSAQNTAASVLSGSITQTTGVTIDATQNTFNIAVNGVNSGNAVTVTLAAGAYGTYQGAALVSALNTAIGGTALSGHVSAGFDAATGKLDFTTIGTGSSATVAVTNGASNDLLSTTVGKELGFVSGASGTGTTTAGAAPTSGTALSTVQAYGTSATGAQAFTALKYGDEKQVLTFSANTSTGQLETKSITLQNNVNSTSGSSIDNAIAYINQQLQASTTDPALQSIVAVKQAAGGQEKINFISSLTGFSVGVGSTGTSDGVSNGAATTLLGSAYGAAANVSISTQSGAEAAVTALGTAVAKLGAAQAQVGIGENQLNFAINLAQSQITNFSAAESQIRDTDVAAQAANLSKAQVLQQSTIAAMAQANSAPQAVLSLLKG